MFNQKKVALIAGASRGIGKAVAIGLAQDGYQVCLLSRSVKSLASVANEIAAYHHNSSALKPLIYECDVTDANLVNQVVDDVVNKTGQIDVLFNNAGIYHDGTLENVKHFNDMIGVNLIGAFNILHAVVPSMKTRQAGHIFNLASISGKIGYPGSGAYNASKFGLVGLSESLFHELTPHHVKVTAICPSYVATDMVSDVDFPPANLMIQPSDILQVVRGLLLLSPQACVKEIIVDCQATVSVC